MLSLPAEIILEKNKLGDTTPWLITVELLLNNGGTIIRLVNNNEDIVVDGHTYTKFPFRIEPIQSNLEGELTTASLTVSNANRFLQYYVELYDGCVDSVVNLRIFNNNYKQYTKAALVWQFTIINAVCTDTEVKFSLGAKNPLLQKFPQYKYYANHCKWKFLSAECGYSGYSGYSGFSGYSGYTGFSGYSGLDLTCKRTLDDCTAKLNTLRFGGYPGLQVGSFRLV